MERRSFVQALFLGAFAATKLGDSVWASNYDSYQSSQQYKKSYLVNCEILEERGIRDLGIYNLETGNITQIHVEFAPHTITRVSEDIIVCCEKYGPNAIVVDMKKGKIIASHTYTDEDQQEYMGHCLYDPAKNVIYTTEQNKFVEFHNDRHKGTVKIREPFTLKVLGQFDSYGCSPHDLLFTHDGKIAICNTAGAELSFSQARSFWYTENRNVAIVNSDTYELIQRIEMPNNFFCPGHIKRNGTNLIVSGIHSYLEEIDFLWDHINWNPINIDKDYNVTMFKVADYVGFPMDAEFLSTAINYEHQVVAMTVPAKGSINIWSLKDMSYLAHISLPLPKGIFHHPEGYFMVATANGFYKIDPVTFKVSFRGLRQLGNGLSHSYVI
jgi:hypothetical protein